MCLSATIFVEIWKSPKRWHENTAVLSLHELKRGRRDTTAAQRGHTRDSSAHTSGSGRCLLLVPPPSDALTPLPAETHSDMMSWIKWGPPARMLFVPAVCPHCGHSMVRGTTSQVISGRGFSSLYGFERALLMVWCLLGIPRQAV